MAGITQEKAPEVGMGATLPIGSDRYAATVVEVSKSGKRVVLQYDTVTVLPSSPLCESYSFETNPNGVRMTFTLRRDGYWTRLGQSGRNAQIAHLGHRRHYRDPSF
jgi:hypothetical protein